MTREQIDALETLLVFDPGSTLAEFVPKVLDLARRALDLEEALEFAASDKASLYKSGDGRYCCVLFNGGAGVEENFFGSTPLEAIQNARKETR